MHLQAPSMCIKCEAGTNHGYDSNWNATKPVLSAKSYVSGMLDAYTYYTYYPDKNWSGYTTNVHPTTATILDCAKKAKSHRDNFFSYQPSTLTCWIQSPKPINAPVNIIIPTSSSRAGNSGRVMGFNTVPFRDFKNAFDLGKGRYRNTEEECAQACFADDDCVVASKMYRGCYFKGPASEPGIYAGTVVWTVWR